MKKTILKLTVILGIVFLQIASLFGQNQFTVVQRKPIEYFDSLHNVKVEGFLEILNNGDTLLSGKWKFTQDSVVIIEGNYRGEMYGEWLYFNSMKDTIETRIFFEGKLVGLHRNDEGEKKVIKRALWAYKIQSSSFDMFLIYVLLILFMLLRVGLAKEILRITYHKGKELKRFEEKGLEIQAIVFSLLFFFIPKPKARGYRIIYNILNFPYLWLVAYFFYYLHDLENALIITDPFKKIEISQPFLHYLFP